MNNGINLQHAFEDCYNYAKQISDLKNILSDANSVLSETIKQNPNWKQIIVDHNNHGSNYGVWSPNEIDNQATIELETVINKCLNSHYVYLKIYNPDYADWGDDGCSGIFDTENFNTLEELIEIFK